MRKLYRNITLVWIFHTIYTRRLFTIGHKPTCHYTHRYRAYSYVKKGRDRRLTNNDSLPCMLLEANVLSNAYNEVLLILRLCVPCLYLYHANWNAQHSPTSICIHLYRTIQSYNYVGSLVLTNNSLLSYLDGANSWP